MSQDKVIDQSRYKSVFDLSPEGIVLLDHKGKILEANQRLFDWLNYSPEEILGKNLLKMPFLTAKGKITVMEKFAQRMLGKKPAPYKLDFISKGSTDKKIGLIRAVAIKDAKGKIIEDLVMIANITEEEEHEVQIKQNLEHQKLLSDIAIKFNSLDNFDKIINETLKILGEYTDVSRVYIFEDSSDGKNTSNTFEWCNKGVSCQKNNLQDVPYTTIPSWKKILKKEGAVLSNNINKLPKDLYDILAPQNIKAILVLPLYVKEKFFGFIGFDEIKKDREWTELDKEFLKTISGLIANAYQRKIADETLNSKIQELENMNKLMINRELKMVELKNKLKKVEGK